MTMDFPRVPPSPFVAPSFTSTICPGYSMFGGVNVASEIPEGFTFDFGATSFVGGAVKAACCNTIASSPNSMSTPSSSISPSFLRRSKILAPYLISVLCPSASPSIFQSPFCNRLSFACLLEQEAFTKNSSVTVNKHGGIW